MTSGANTPLTGSETGRRARLADLLFKNATLTFALSVVVVITAIAIALFVASIPNIKNSGLSFLTTSTWNPVPRDADQPNGDVYGLLPFVYGTLVTSAIALLIAVPLSVGAAIFLSEIAPKWLSTPVSFLVEMLAAVPSIVYGFWALIYLVPLLQNGAEKWLGKNFGQIPLFAPYKDAGSGNDYLAAGLILALMILPFITAVSRDVLRTVPQAQREAAYGMGATQWEAIKSVVLRYASSGIIGAIMLGLGRAVGETMAVTLVIGSSSKSFPNFSDLHSFSLFRPGYTMTAILADQYPSPNSPLHTSALTQIALGLFVVTVIVNAAARGLVWLTALKSGGTSSDATLKAKALTGAALQGITILIVAAIFGFQIWQDISAHGPAGILGGAGLISIVIVGIAIFSARVPGTSIFIAWRRLVNTFSLVMCGVCAFVAVASLALLLFFVAKEGLSSINGQFFLPPNGIDLEKGGMLHAIVGTLEFIGMASLLGIPIGVLGGLFLSEFGTSKLAFYIRFAADLLNGVPSIVIGIFAYTLMIMITHASGIEGFLTNAGLASPLGLAGGFALGVMMIPTVMRTTEELVKLVPQSLREGSLALGATQVTTVWQVVLPSARTGIVTGILLAVARIAGETAPLLMVGCNSSVWNIDPRKAMASLPVQIYVLRDQPGDLVKHQLWGVALVLVVIVLVTNLLARFLTREKMGTAK